MKFILEFDAIEERPAARAAICATDLVCALDVIRERARTVLKHDGDVRGALEQIGEIANEALWRVE